MSKKVDDKKVQEFESYIDEEPIAPVSCNKYNPYELKGNIDDTIINLLEEKKFEEDNKNMNLKIILGSLCIGVAAVSQLYKKDDPDWKFPKNWIFQSICVAIYGIIMGGYYYVENYMMGDVFFSSVSCPVSTYDSSGQQNDLLFQPILIYRPI